MTVVARGHYQDRPFGRTIVTIAARHFTGDLIVDADGVRHVVAWRDGVVVAADSASPFDSPARVALAAGLVTSTQIGDLARALAADPAADPIGLLAEIANLSAEQIRLVSRHTMAQRALRLFAVEQGNFELDNASRLVPDADAVPLDARWLVYQGVRMHYSDARLARELEQLMGTGTILQLSEGAPAQLAAFGFGDAERSLLTKLRHPMSMIELLSGDPGHDHRLVLAPLYALVATGCVAVSVRPAPAPGLTTAALPRARRRSSSGHAPVVRADDRRFPAGSNARVRVVRGPTVDQAVPDPAALRTLVNAGVLKMKSGGDYASLLGVSGTATLEEIQAAYQELSRQLQPELIRAAQLHDLIPEAGRYLAQVNNAFAILSHPKRHQRHHHGRARAARSTATGASPGEAKVTKELAAEEHFRRGEMALRRDQFAEAMSELTQAVELNPKRGELHATLAWATWCAAPTKTEVASAVKKSLDRAIQLAPDDAIPLLYRGRIARQEGRDELALTCFERALELAPGNFDARTEAQVLRARIVKGKAAKGKPADRSKR